MTKDYKDLIAQYPKLFETCFYIDCGPGWYDLLKSLLEELDRLIKKESWELPPTITQVKEKWGLLRVYMTFETDEIAKMLESYEDKSAYVCDECGSLGDLQTEPIWFCVRCDRCK